MGKFETNQVDINGDGRVILYQRPDVKNPKWQCRISVQGSTGYKIFSTKESDQRKAERVALDRYQDLYFKVRDGGSLNGKPFNEVYSEWLGYLELSKSNKAKGYVQTITQKVRDSGLEYFKSKPIDEITEADLLEMMLWYKKKTKSSYHGKKEVSTSTLRQTGFAIKDLFKYSRTKGYIKQVPHIEMPSLIRNPRPDFKIEEWRKLTTYMRKWVDEKLQGKNQKAYHSPRIHRERFYLQHYVLVMANTGIRIGEMRNVKWNDLDRVILSEEDERLLISVDGKTGKRQVVANAGTENYIKRIYDFRKEELGKEPDKTENIFCHTDGTAVGEYSGGFENLLKKCDLWENKDGDRRTLYSLRHTYATMRINEVPIYQLAINMGTSVEMIENYYGHSRTSDKTFAQTVTKGNQTPSSKVLPF